MDMTASVAGSPYFAPNPGDSPSVDGYPQHGVWAGGETTSTQPVARRPISQSGDDARDDAEIGALERQLAAQQREIRELRHELRADRREDAIRPDLVSRFECQGVLLRISEALWISGAIRSTKAVSP